MQAVVSGGKEELLNGNVYQFRLGVQHLISQPSGTKDIYGDKNDVWAGEVTVAPMKSKSYDIQVDPETDILTGRRKVFEYPVYEINSGDTLLIFAHEVFRTGSIETIVFDNVFKLYNLNVSSHIIPGPVVTRIAFVVQNPTSNRYYLRAGTIMGKVILKNLDTIVDLEASALEEALKQPVTIPIPGYSSL
ncbi:MAG: hypothetical protein ACYCQJ_14580 [Nitrososphaerales archaeon]